jgi:hypothetical protein
MKSSDNELSRLLREIRTRLAGHKRVKVAEIEHQWADALGYSHFSVQNWLRSRGSSRPPDEALRHIIKEGLQAGVIDSSIARSLINKLSQLMRPELHSLLSSDTSRDRIVIFNVPADQSLAYLIASRLSAEFHISFDATHSPDRFQGELQKAAAAIGLHTSAATQDELFNHRLEDVQFRKQNIQLSAAVLVHEGSIARVESQGLQDFQTVFWPRAQDQQEQALERLRHILRGDAVEEDTISAPEELLNVPWEREDLGAVPLDSHFYIERVTDRRALRTADQPSGSHILIKGPRQVGKSSLLLRVTEFARRKGKRVVELNLQALRAEMDDLDDLLYAICDEIRIKLKLPNTLRASWAEGRAPLPRCQNYLLEHVLKIDLPPLILALDEVDTVYDRPFKNEFFGMLRAWINEGRLGTDTGKQMSHLELALVTSTEPRLFITDYQSPFNILEPIVLQDFTLQQTAELNQRHHGLLPAKQLDQLFGLLSGHIYLTRRALNLIESGEVTFDRLMKTANDSVNGPFSSHLETMWSRLPKEPEMLNELREILRSGKWLDEKILYRLVGGGVVNVTGKERKAKVRCKLYEIFLSQRLRK